MDANEHEGAADFRCESFDHEGEPSYGLSTVVSLVFLAGFLYLFFNHPVPVSPVILIGGVFWFGILVSWTIRDRGARNALASDRVTIMNGRVTQTFRYLVSEASHVELGVDDLREIRLHGCGSVTAELIGQSDADFIKLPNEEKARSFCETLQRLNPEIRVTEE